jgi:selenocysteine lyase/cysteine desulfurase
MERRWMSEAQANTLEWFSYKVRPMLREIRAKLATYLSVRSFPRTDHGQHSLKFKYQIQVPTSTVVFVENASQGINAVVRSLNFKPTDTVLLTNVTYGMARNAVLFAQKRFGFNIITVDLSFPTDENQILEAFRPHLEGGNVTLALFDHISSGPAVIFPLDKLIPMAKENGAMVLVDGAHAVGQVPLNLTALNPDFYVSNGHKWMCSPPGSAFLYVRSELQYLIHPTVISFGYNPTLNNTYVAEFEWIGTRDFSAWLAWKTALEFRLNLTDTAVHAYNNDLCLNASQLFIDRWPGAYRLAPSNMTASLTNVVIPCNNKGNNSTAGCYVGWDLVSLYEVLHTKWNIWPFITELYPGGPRYIRLSCQIYLSLADYELLATAMDSVISWN